MPKTIFGGGHPYLVEVFVEARKADCLTHAQLAQLVDKDQTFVSLIERGQRRVDVLEFLALANAMKANPVALMEKVCSRITYPVTIQHRPIRRGRIGPFRVLTWLPLKRGLR